MFYTGNQKDKDYFRYPNYSDGYTVLTYSINRIKEPSIFIKDKLQKAITQELIFYCEGRDDGLYVIKDEEFLRLAQEKYSKLLKVDAFWGKIPSLPQSLLKYGEDLTHKKYYSDPAIARDKELLLVELGLLTPKKSPLLVGLPGVGKTAIAEGLAYRIQNNNVPLALQNKIIFNIDSASLISGCQYVGMVEQNIKELINGIKNRDDIILFIDEFHTLIGLGMGSKDNIDAANMFKPYLANGEITIIGSTILEEYNKVVLKDKAFARRFELINVLETKLEDVIKILYGSIPYYEQVTGVNFSFNDKEKQIIFACISQLTNVENRIQEKYYPDIALEIISNAFGFARLNSRSYVCLEDIIQAISVCNTVNEQAKNNEIDNLKEELAQLKRKLKKWF